MGGLRGGAEAGFVEEGSLCVCEGVTSRRGSGLHWSESERAWAKLVVVACNLVFGVGRSCWSIGEGSSERRAGRGRSARE